MWSYNEISRSHNLHETEAAQERIECASAAQGFSELHGVAGHTRVVPGRKGYEDRGYIGPRLHRASEDVVRL